MLALKAVVPQFEVRLVFQDGVNLGKTGDLLAPDFQSFGGVGSSGMVDDEARSVLGHHRGVAHFTCILAKLFDHTRPGVQARYHLNHFHQGYGVEEVKPHHVAFACQTRSDCCDRQR